MGAGVCVGAAVAGSGVGVSAGLSEGERGADGDADGDVNTEGVDEGASVAVAAGDEHAARAATAAVNAARRNFISVTLTTEDRPG